jgi:hypothetical protein
MRLLNTSTLRLEEFGDSTTVPYAILSHTWANEEVSYADMADVAAAEKRKGFSKIQAVASIAANQGHGYVWVDTCCIDKSSSAELSEAINSMFRWYEDAQVCYAFLADLNNMEPGLSASLDGSLESSRWFRRGWTLQELIAPKKVVFLDAAWNTIGTKASLSSRISSITGIDKVVLDCSDVRFEIPLARRMSWAASRDTTRLEDRAYSLLGLFDVNMSMIYGEGEKAFIRLQEEILKKTTDLSLFAWSFEQPTSTEELFGVLATTPGSFMRCKTVMAIRHRQFIFQDEITLTNKGIKLTTKLETLLTAQRSPHNIHGIFKMTLNCAEDDDVGYPPSIIWLTKRGGIYYRIGHGEWTTVRYKSNTEAPTPIYLATRADPRSLRSISANLKPSQQLHVEICVDSNRAYVKDIQGVPDRLYSQGGPMTRFSEWMPSHTSKDLLLRKVQDCRFDIDGLHEFYGLLRFQLIVRSFAASPDSKLLTEPVSFIIMFHRVLEDEWEYNLVTQRDVIMNHVAICPFQDIDAYGPSGDELAIKQLWRSSKVREMEWPPEPVPVKNEGREVLKCFVEASRGDNEGDPLFNKMKVSLEV